MDATSTTIGIVLALSVILFVISLFEGIGDLTVVTTALIILCCVYFLVITILWLFGCTFV